LPKIKQFAHDAYQDVVNLIPFVVALVPKLMYGPDFSGHGSSEISTTPVGAFTRSRGWRGISRELYHQDTFCGGVPRVSAQAQDRGLFEQRYGLHGYHRRSSPGTFIRVAC